MSTNQRPVFRSRDLSRPIRGQYYLEELDNEEDEAQDGVHLGDLDLPEGEVHREVLRRNNQMLV